LSVDFTPQAAVIREALELALAVTDEQLRGGGVGERHDGLLG
jgi:hypothetical protein